MQRIAIACLLLFAGTLAAEDSPLVAAAKSRKNAKQKAKVVITNETLSKSGGHISTTASQRPIALPKEEASKAQPQVKTIGAGTKSAEKPEQETSTTTPAMIDDVERAGEGPLTQAELDYINQEMKPPVHILPKGMTPIQPQQSNKGIEPQQSQKPKPR